MFVKLDEEIVGILCCPLCKADMEVREQEFICKDCATRYPRRGLRYQIQHSRRTYTAYAS